MTRTHTWRRTIRLVRNRAHDIRLNPLSKTLATQHNNKRSTTGDFSELSHVYNVSCRTTQRVRCGRDRTDDLCIATHQSSGTLGGFQRSGCSASSVMKPNVEKQKSCCLFTSSVLQHTTCDCYRSRTRQ